MPLRVLISRLFSYMRHQGLFPCRGIVQTYRITYTLCQIESKSAYRLSLWEFVVPWTERGIASLMTSPQLQASSKVQQIPSYWY